MLTFALRPLTTVEAIRLSLVEIMTMTPTLVLRLTLLLKESTAPATTTSTRAGKMEKRFYTRSYDDQYITIYNPSKQTLYLVAWRL